MDIEKDSNREAFESWFESRYDANFMQFALDLDMYVDKHTQKSWEAWQAAKAKAVPECTWMGAYDCSVFESSCGHTFELSNDGTLDDNNMKHCCFCGGKIEAQEPTND